MFRKKALRINPYLGYGTKTVFRASGRALKVKNVDFSANQNVLQTLHNIYKQLESDEIRNTDIKLTLPNGQIIEAKTDQEGYYHVELNSKDIENYIDQEGWLPYTASYKKTDKFKNVNYGQNQFKSQMLVPFDDAEYGIISDIDDTILHTGVASIMKWRLVVNTIFKNFDKRKAIEGTVTFYKKLQNGTNGNPVNPFFYVSNSPWNLYDYLSAFFRKHNFPKGPILLRDFRTPFDKTPKPKMPHKKSEILSLLGLYPNLKFILIGDSGEKDADIYTKIAQDYPGRILAIYLRNVKHRRKEKRIQKLISSFNDVPVLLTNTAEEAMIHAQSIRLIK